MDGPLPTSPVGEEPDRWGVVSFFKKLPGWFSLPIEGEGWGEGLLRTS